MSSISRSATEVLLAARDLSIERGDRLLCRGLSFDVGPGELLRIMGENGAGKTSLLRALAGLARYSWEGALESDGVSLRSDALAHQRRILYLGHDPAVKALLSPRENLAWHLAAEPHWDAPAIAAALVRVGLAGFEDEPCHALSQGQRRRVNLARLHLTRRPLWLLDEPFTAIDVDGVASLGACLLAHLQAGGAVILTSHQPLELDYPCRELLLRPESAA